MAVVRMTIEIDPGKLGTYPDAHLATLWHVAQANPAPHGDHAAGRLVEQVGREIIRRWLRATEPELWHHQGRDYYHRELCRLATFTPGDGEPGSEAWHDGVWVPRPTGPLAQPAGNGVLAPNREGRDAIEEHDG